MFILSVSLMGIATGITMWDVANIKYIDEIPGGIDKDIYEVIYEMKDNTTFIDRYYDNVYYHVDESLGNKIKIQISYYKGYSNVNATYDYDKYINVHYSSDTLSIKDTIDLLISDLSKKQVHLYSDLYSYEVNIYTTSKNKDKLLNNRDKHIKQEDNDRYQELSSYYFNQINEYERKIQELYDEYNAQINNLEDEKFQLMDKIHDLEGQIQGYELKIKEYKDSINNLLKD